MEYIIKKFIFIIIITIITILVYYYLNYQLNYNFEDKIININNKLNINNNIDFEYSIKIGKDTINENRTCVIYNNLLQKDIVKILKYLNVSKEFNSFIKKHNNSKYSELMYAHDNNIEKIYIMSMVPYTGIIYGLENDGINYKNRVYKQIFKNQVKYSLSNFLKEPNSLIDNIFKELEMLKIITGFEKYNYKNEMETLLIKFEPITLKHFRNSILNLSLLFLNDNNQTLNNWINKNENKFFHIIAFSKKNKKKYLSIYIRNTNYIRKI